MDLNSVVRHLNAGEQWGFVKPTGDPEYLGWILLRKRRPRLTSFDPIEEPTEYKRSLQQSKEVEERPYHLFVIELRRDVHEAGDYPFQEDYRLRKSYYLGSLDEVKHELQGMGFSLCNALPRSELDAP